MNPGIKITHISALNNSISYNETHNVDNKREKTVTGGFKMVEAVSGDSIFRELKAEILGISLVDILQHALSLDDLPIFAYVKQFEQTTQRIQELQREFSNLTSGWISEYNGLVSKIETLKNRLGNYEEQLRLLSKTDARVWLETAIELAGAMSYYRQQAEVLENNKAELLAYRQKCMDPIKLKITTIVSNLNFDLSASLDAFFINTTIAGATALAGKIDQFKKTNPGIFKEKYLKESLKIYLITKIQSGLDAVLLLNNYNALLDALGKEVGTEYSVYYQEILEGISEAMDYATVIGKHYESQIKKRVDEMVANMPFIIEKLVADLKVPLNKNDIENWIFALYELSKIYDNYHRYYNSLKDEYYLTLIKELKIPVTGDQLKAAVDPITVKLQKIFEADLKSLKLIAAPKVIDDAFNILQNKLLENGVTIQNYEKSIASVNVVIDETLSKYLGLASELYGNYEKLLREIEKVKADLQVPQKLVENFIFERLKNLEKELYKTRDELILAGKGTPHYQRLQEKMAQIEQFLHKIKSLTRQKLDYNFKTRKFRKASLGGVIEFLPERNITELAINIKYEIELDITSLSGPPSIGRQSHVTDSSLSNFKLGLLQLLYVDFERVRFVTGSDVKDDFQVQIRNVEFAGFLSFFQAFQEYLKSLSDNLVFDINVTGARIGYGITIPDITAGAFNFFNLSLTGLLTLPFQPDKSMQLNFGIGNELNKFGLTVMGVFGGQGYFNIIAEPKRGIVGMEVVLEFGAIFNLNLGVAQGTAYLVGGIYIKKYDKMFELRGYILCVGRLRILALFSASVTFYLGLEGDSQVLQGVCRVTVSHKFSPFFEVSVSFEMKKIIKGTKTKETENQQQLYSGIDSIKNIQIADTNLYKELFYKDESAYVTIKKGDKNDQPLVAVLTHTNKNTIKPINVKSEGDLEQFIIPLSKLSSGEYELSIVGSGGRIIKKNFVLANPESYEDCEPSIKGKNEISLKNYYSSYF